MSSARTASSNRRRMSRGVKTRLKTNKKSRKGRYIQRIPMGNGEFKNVEHTKLK